MPKKSKIEIKIDILISLVEQIMNVQSNVNKEMANYVRRKMDDDMKINANFQNITNEIYSIKNKLRA